LSGRVVVRHDFNDNGSLLDYIMIIRKKDCRSNKNHPTKDLLNHHLAKKFFGRNIVIQIAI
jgi:hypothetical protein